MILGGLTDEVASAKHTALFHVHTFSMTGISALIFSSEATRVARPHM